MFKVNNKSYIFTYAFLVFLLILVGVLNILSDVIESNIYGVFAFLFISFYFIAVVFIWIISVRRRVLNDAFKRQYTAIAVYLILILATKMVKYRFIWDDTVERYIWYFWYPLMIFVPLNAFYACLYLGKEEEYHISRKWYFLYIPAAIVSLLIMTNDLHQLCFRFNDNFVNYSNDYTRGILYYIVVAWLSILFLAVLIITLVRCGNSKSKKLIYVPILVLIIGSFGFLGIVLFDKYDLPTVYSFPDFFSIFVVIYLESLIQINLVRTNVGYISFYQKSDILSIITDDDLNITYTTNLNLNVPKQTLQNIINGYDDFNPNRKYHYTKLKYGYFFWASDITEINQLKEQLLDIGISLDDENEIIRAENELTEKKVRIEKQDEIVNKINNLVRQDIFYVTTQIRSLSEDDYVERVKRIFIPICYIKRRINMFLISYTENNLEAKELSYSLNELLEYIKSLGIDAGYSITDDVSGGNDIIFALEHIYSVILFYLDIMDSIYIHCGKENNQNVLRIMVDHTVEKAYPENLFTAYSYEDNTSIITIYGGDNND